MESGQECRGRERRRMEHTDGTPLRIGREERKQSRGDFKSKNG